MKVMMKYSLECLLVGILFCSLAVMTTQAQPCETFTASAGGWTGSVASVAWMSTYLRVKDLAGTTASMVMAPATYLGDWWKLTDGCGGNFCFSIRLTDDSIAASNPPIARTVVITSATYGLTAYFTTTTTIVQGTTWFVFCAPFNPIVSTGNYPTTTNGVWTTSPSPLTPAQWFNLFTTVSSVGINIDISSLQTEVIDFDNICIKSNIVPVAVPVISGPVTACNPTNIYCVSNYVSTQSYQFYAFAPDGSYVAVTPISPGCVSIDWPANGGSLTVSTSSLNSCGTNKAGIKIAACDPLTIECCTNKNVTVTSKTISFSGNTLIFKPVIQYTALTAKIVTTLVGGVSYSTVCPASVTATTSIPTVLSPYTPYVSTSGFTGSTPPISNAQEVDWLAGDIFSTSGTFPLVISTLPAPPVYPCYQQVNFCVKYSVYSACCSSCDIYECYQGRRGAKVIINGNPIPLPDGTTKSIAVNLVNPDDTAQTKDPIIGTITAINDPSVIQGLRSAASGTTGKLVFNASFVAAGTFDVVVDAFSPKNNYTFSSEVFSVVVDSPAGAYQPPAYPIA